MSELAQKVWAKTLLWTGRNAIIGGIEHPSDDHPYSAWVDVRGWAIGLDAQSALTVEFLVGDNLVHSVTPNEPRPDVGARFAGVPGADRCGFDARLTTAVLPWQGASVLTVRAVSESPHKGYAILGTRRIRRQETTTARGNYGGVWDDSGVSGSIVNARISVAGNADPEEYSPLRRVHRQRHRRTGPRDDERHGAGDRLRHGPDRHQAGAALRPLDRLGRVAEHAAARAGHAPRASRTSRSCT